MAMPEDSNTVWILVLKNDTMKISTTSILKRQIKDRDNNIIEKPYFTAILIKDNERQRKER